MEFFKPDIYLDVMKHRKVFVTLSMVLMFGSIASLFYLGPNLGVDFRGGTEIELEFKGGLSIDEIRETMMALGYHRPDVISVEGKKSRYIVRVQDVSLVPEEQVQRIRESLQAALADNALEELKVSPGGDVLSLRFGSATEADVVESALKAAGANVRSVNVMGRPDDNRFEARLAGVADEIVSGLRQRLGEQGPEAPLRVEWIGPKAGAQLRDSAIRALLYTLAFMLVYVAFRFDLRFAPGAVVALLHDAVVTLGVYVLLQKEVTLATVAAVLTVVGYSINDTIVIYDRIRENMTRMRGASLRELINVSTSQTLSRTLIMSLTAVFSIAPFMVWGTPVIQDISFALLVGFTAGIYSTIFVAAPLTEWMDRRFFRRA